MNKVILHIDTSDNKEVKIGLTIEGKDYLVTQKPDHRKAQVILPMVERLLKDNELALQDISNIDVNTGPGSFTGLRVGVAIANTLGMLLHIPINGGKVGEFVEPTY
jgi:tRNA threonylcarbamoyl adenosine modification protein YeaZ